jgi:hypothetical protein
MEKMPVWLFQNATPDTIAYMILGYAIIGGVGLVYVTSLLLRQRNLKRDLEVMARLRDEDDD